MQPLNFSLIFSGTVNPNGGDEEATGIAMQRGELYANLEQIVCDITGKGLVTGDTPATLEDHSHRVRITEGRFDMMAMPVISTAHLDQATAQELSDKPDACSWAIVANYGAGMFIRFLEQEGLEAELPQCAADIRQWLKRQGLDGWVHLDRDWDAVDVLKTYEW